MNNDEHQGADRLSVLSIGSILRPLANAAPSVFDSLARRMATDVPSISGCLARLARQVTEAQERLKRETRQLERLAQEGRKALAAAPDQNPIREGTLEGDLYMLYENGRSRAEAAPGEPARWGADIEAAFDRVCCKHLSFGTVFNKGDRPTRVAFATYRAELGVSPRGAWRELVGGTVLKIIDDHGDSRRVGDPETPFGAFPIFEPDATLRHARRIIRREVKAFLPRWPPSSKYREVLQTGAGAMPEEWDRRSRRDLDALEIRDLLLTALTPNELELCLRYETEDRDALASELGRNPATLRKQVQRMRDKTRSELGPSAPR